MRRDERGAVLPLMLIILLVLAALVTALLATGVIEPQIAANVLRGGQALSAAEAGAERQIADFIANSGPVDCAMATPADGCAASTAAQTPYTNQAAGNVGTYTVTYRPVSYATVLIESTGRANVGGTQRTVRVIVTKHWTTNFGVLGNQVEIKGSARVVGTAGAVQGNASTKLDTSALVQQTATTSGTVCDHCTDNPCGTACDVSPPSYPPSSAHGVGITSASGTGAPLADIATATPLDFRSKATVILGDGTTPIPASCVGQPGVGGNTVVPEHQILTVATCTLTAENTGVFSGFRMHGAGEWELSGNNTPPNGAFYALKEIKVTGTPGTSTTPWTATLIAGDTKERGRVEVTGNSNIASYLGDLLAIAGEIKAEGNTTLKGTLIATGSGDANGGGSAVANVAPGEGKLELKGSVLLKGNAVTNGRAKVGGNAEVRYNVSTRSRVLSPKLRIVSWSTA